MQLVWWIHTQLQSLNPEVKIDWHGHNDRGLALANSLAAVATGAERIHATHLGIGERAGNTSLEQLLLNFKLTGQWRPSLETLTVLSHRIAQLLAIEIPSNTPIIGSSVFGTSSGIHTAAILKASQSPTCLLKDPNPDLVYLAYPPELVSGYPEIQINLQSGHSTVKLYLERRGIPHSEQTVERILHYAKAADHILTLEEVARAGINSPETLEFYLNLQGFQYTTQMVERILERTSQVEYLSADEIASIVLDCRIRPLPIRSMVA